MLRVVLCSILFSVALGAKGQACSDLVSDKSRLDCFDRLAVCRDVSGYRERLVCYDREFGNTSIETTNTVLPETTSTPISSQEEPSPGQVPAESPPKRKSENSVENSAVSSFGLPAEKREASHITSRISGDFSGYSGKQRFQLENGQVWQMRRDKGVRRFKALKNPEVIIKTNVLGFYVMSIPTIKLKLPVKRLK